MASSMQPFMALDRLRNGAPGPGITSAKALSAQP
jgi:hypothetical protein